MADSPQGSASNSEVLRLKAEIERLRAASPRSDSPQPPPSAPAGTSSAAAGTPMTPAARTEETTRPTAAAPSAPPASTSPKPAPAAAAPAAAGSKPTPPSAPKPGAAADKPADGDAEAPRERAGIARRTYQAAGAFSTSMIVHAVGLLILGLWTLPAIIQDQLVPLTVTEPTPQEELTEVLPEETDPSQQINFEASASTPVVGLTTGHSSQLAGANSGPPAMAREVAESIEGPAVELNDFSVFGVGGGELAQDAGVMAAGEPAAVVNDYAEAMDRITQEILMYLLKSDVLVLWMFDQSESMKDDQREIRDRVERVYQELGLTETAQGDALLTSVASFGENFMLHTTRPTHDLDEIRGAIDAVPLDPSGLEHTWRSAGQMINIHRKFASAGKRQLMLVVVTDESGEYEENVANLEGAIAEAKAARCPIYILGREAVFGYPYAFMNWTEPESKLNFWLQINRGPETPDPEQLQTNGFYRRYDAFPSGFGPFEQSRAARETGGVFFLLPSPEVNLVGRDDRKYAAAMMRPYLPDLSPRDQYVAGRDQVELRATIWKVITDLNPYNPQVQPHIEMRHTFSLALPALLQERAVELAKAEHYFRYLHAAEEALEGIKRKRDAEPNARWRANYDLIYAQVVAYKVRLYEYGAYLDWFGRNPKPILNPYKNVEGFPVQSTHWELGWRTETLTDATTKEYQELSRKLFQKVLEEHPGTPWAARAEWELARGFGVELVEAYDDPRRAALGIKLPKL
jgi:hypothetical protein